MENLVFRSCFPLQPIADQRSAACYIPTTTNTTKLTVLAITPIRLRIMTLPRLSPPSRRLIEFMSLAQPSRFLARCSEAAGFAVLERVSQTFKDVQ